MEGEETVDRAWALWSQLLEQFIAWAPRLVAVLLVLLVGWLAAVLTRRLVAWGFQRLGLEALFERLGVARLLYGLGLRRSSTEVAAQLGFWTVVLLTLHTVATFLGMPGISQALATLVGFLPRLLVSLGILCAGLLGADVLRRLVGAMLARQKGIDSPQIVARGLYWIVVLLAAAVAIEQLGVHVDLINALIQIIVGAVGLGLALAFGLGSRDIIRDLIARFYVMRLYRPGDRVEVGGVQGTIVGFSPTAVILRDGEHERILPCHELIHGAVTLQRVSQEHAAPPEPAEEVDPPPGAR